MPIEDAIRWNERYQNNDDRDLQVPRSFLTEHLHMLPAGGLALDLAMGAGKNTAALLARGYQVVGVDISSEAVRRAKQSFPELMAVIADLTHFCLPAQTFDLVLNFYYLQREMFPEFKRILKPGGMLVYETLQVGMREVKPEIQLEYLLQPGELRAAFQDWDILVYREGWVENEHGHSKAIASMIARRPCHE